MCRRCSPSNLIWHVYILAVLVFLYAPIAVLILFSFNESKYMTHLTGFTLEWYTRLVENVRILNALENSVSIALVSAVVSTLLGLLAAYSVRRAPYLSLKLDTLMVPPIVIPEVAEAVSLMMFFYMVGAEYGWLTVFIGHTAFNISYAYVTIKGQIHSISPNIEKIAQSLGAGSFAVFRRIVIPLLTPALMASFLVTFITSFSDFVKTVFTTGPGFETLPLYVWRVAVRGRATPELNALATLMILVSLVISIYYTRRIITKLGESYQKQG